MKKLAQILLLLLIADVAAAQYSSLLWKITGEKIRKPSYLFGTMHTSDARVFDKVKAAMPLFSSAKAYAMELDPDKLFDMSLMGKVMMGKEYSLKKMIPAEEYSFLDSVAIKNLGWPLMIFDNVEPVFIMTILESLEMGLTDSSIAGNDQIMDMYFFNQAKKAKKKVIGIETVTEQLEALHVISYEEQALMLVEEIKAIREKSGTESEAKELLNFYLKQQLDSLDTGVEDMPAKFYDAIVTQRNERMANRIAEFIKEQPTFIAIGALHLPGASGVIERLRKKGFSVVPVKI